MSRKIMFVSSLLRYGGGERWMLDAAAGMKARGHRVLLVSRPGSMIGDKARAMGIDCATVEMRGDLDPAAIYYLAKLIRTFQPDIVCPNLDREIRLCGFGIMLARRRWKRHAAAGKSCSKLIPRRGSEFPLKNNSHYRFFYTNFVQTVIANSHATKKTMLSRTPWFSDEKVVVVHNGIDLKTHDRPQAATLRMRKALRDSLNIAHDAPLVTLIGELNERKGQQYLIEAAQNILNDHATTRFLLVGDGDAKQAIEQTLAKKNLKKTFLLAGFRDDIPEILAASDILVLPSRVEGFGYVLVEAMAAGLPVVASRISSIPEIVTDGETGFLHEVGNIDQIADCLSRLIGDQNLADKMGKAGRRSVEKLFDLDGMLDRLENVFWPDVIPNRNPNTG
jgi:glycosyltransferase involved in cell wall biosynthesis